MGRKSKTIIETEKQDPFSLFVIASDDHDLSQLITSSLSTKHDLLLFKIFVSKLEMWKMRHFHGRPRATLNLQ